MVYMIIIIQNTLKSSLLPQELLAYAPLLCMCCIQNMELYMVLYQYHLNINSMVIFLYDAYCIIPAIRSTHHTDRQTLLQRTESVRISA
jgi:hypothetical protein